MAHSNLENYYRMNFAICHFHKWDIASVENLIPFELQIYHDLIAETLKETKQQGDGGYGQLAKELRLNG